MNDTINKTNLHESIDNLSMVPDDEFVKYLKQGLEIEDELAQHKIDAKNKEEKIKNKFKELEETVDAMLGVNKTVFKIFVSALKKKNGVEFLQKQLHNYQEVGELKARVNIEQFRPKQGVEIQSDSDDSSKTKKKSKKNNPKDVSDNDAA